ncbi:MAG: ABC-three component system protein [Fusobacteriaceae bacterium]
MQYDATSSWSGFQYQGKVAIYYVIKLLNGLSIEEVDNYSLEIEYLEDFSIKKSSEYVSCHQVKARTKVTTMSSYLDAILKFYSNNAKSYLHVIKKVNDWNKENLKSLLKVSEEDTLKIFLKDSLDQLEIVDDTLKELIISKIDKEEYNKDLLNLLVSLKDKNSKKKIYEKFKKEIEKTICLLDIDNFYERIGIYNYESNNYCELNEIEKLIKKELLIFYKNNNLNEFKRKEELEKIYLNLLKKVDEHVLSRHMDTSLAKEIKLRDIRSIIEDNRLLEAGEDYNISLLKNKFYNEIKEYCDECNIECNIKILAENLKLLEKQSFKTILKKINPKINLDTIRSTELISCLENVDVFLNILEGISCKMLLENANIHFIKDKVYQPTLLKYKSDIAGRREVELETLRKKILTNDSFLNLLQENQSLITKDIETKIVLNKNNLEEVDEKLNKSIFCESLNLESKKTVTEKLNGEYIKRNF